MNENWPRKKIVENYQKLVKISQKNWSKVWRKSLKNHRKSDKKWNCTKNGVKAAKIGRVDQKLQIHFDN